MHRTIAELVWREKRFQNRKEVTRRGGTHVKNGAGRHETATKKGTCITASALTSCWRPQGDKLYIYN